MPEVFKLAGFSFFFYSKEHEPIHIHVEGKEGYAKYNYNGEKFEILEQHGLKANDLKRISKAIKDRTQLIIDTWNNHFGG